MAIVFVRTLIVFITLLAAMRLMGKRQLGELELSELVISILIANFAAHPLQDIGIPIMNGLLPVIILLCCELLLSGIIVKSPRARSFLCGKPSILISNGEIDQQEMKKNRFTPEELAEELRNQSIMDISTIKFAILETDGSLNLILLPGEMPVTAAQLNLATPDPGFPMIIISNGRTMSENLALRGKDTQWLKKQLKQRGVKSAKEVYLMTVNDMDQIYFAKTEERQ